jgi:hypothetical protein
MWEDNNYMNKQNLYIVLFLVIPSAKDAVSLDERGIAGQIDVQ